MIKVTEEFIDSIHVSEMKDGDVAVITNWDSLGYNGRVVQRYGKALIGLGLPEGNSWSSIVNITKENSPLCTVRILPKRTKLEVF